MSNRWHSRWISVPAWPGLQRRACLGVVQQRGTAMQKQQAWFKHRRNEICCTDVHRWFESFTSHLKCFLECSCGQVDGNVMEMECKIFGLIVMLYILFYSSWLRFGEGQTMSLQIYHCTVPVMQVMHGNAFCFTDLNLSKGPCCNRKFGCNMCS